MRPAPPAGTKRPFVPRAVLAAPGFPWASRRWPAASAPARRGGAGINHGSSRARRYRRKRPGCAKAFAGRILAHATRPRICDTFAGKGEIAPPQLTLRFRNNCRAPRTLFLALARRANPSAHGLSSCGDGWRLFQERSPPATQDEPQGSLVSGTPLLPLLAISVPIVVWTRR